MFVEHTINSINIAILCTIRFEQTQVYIHEPSNIYIFLNPIMVHYDYNDVKTLSTKTHPAQPSSQMAKSTSRSEAKCICHVSIACSMYRAVTQCRAHRRQSREYTEHSLACHLRSAHERTTYLCAYHSAREHHRQEHLRPYALVRKPVEQLTGNGNARRGAEAARAGSRLIAEIRLPTSKGTDGPCGKLWISLMGKTTQ